MRRIVIGALVLPYVAACSADNTDQGKDEPTSGCDLSCGETTPGTTAPGTPPTGDGTSGPASSGTTGKPSNGPSPAGSGTDAPGISATTDTSDVGPNPTSPGPDATSGSPATSSSEDDSSTTDAPASSCSLAPGAGHYQMENLDRGLIAVRRGNANYVGWRMLGWEYSDEQSRVAYNLYRNEQLLGEVTDSTNYLDDGAPTDARYSVALVVDGQECERSETVSVWSQNYINIPLEPPPGGTAPGGESYAYDTARETRSSGSVSDGSVGDLDGDGTYEVVVIWEPSNAKDNSQSGHTGPVYIDAYKLTGERLWRMNLGPNIRAGAHYTQFLVYDLDGDGKAEVAFRTAPGVKDGTGAFLSKGPAATDDDSRDYRNSDGYVLSGPEYLTVFDGATGAELATVNFETARGTVSSWGDNYGNRVDRFLASVGFVSDLGGSGKGSGRPALLMARGYYTRATVNAYTWRDDKLEKIWTADSNSAGSGALAGQGAHYMAVADVDADGAQEIIYGAAMIQSDGSFGCSTGFGHGDALHVTDLVPSRPGLEVFMPHEDKSKPWWDLRQAEDCKILFQAESNNVDNGRGVAADVNASNPGAEFWSSAESGLRSATTNASVGSKPSQSNFVIWWDADELRETEDGTSIRKANGTEVFSCNQCMSNNHTKATPTLTADLFGDWREEIIWRTPDSSALRIYTTTDVTQRRIYTLMHDPQYRMHITSQQTAYNQPPHPGFFLGDGMEDPPAPDIHVK